MPLRPPVTALNVIPSRPSIRALLLGALLLGAAGAAAEEPDPLARAAALLAEGQGAQAWDLLRPLLESRAGAPEYDHLLGVAALQSGHPTDAVFAFERVLDARPDDAEARAWLARALFEAGENDSARREFEAARAKPLPPQAGETIDHYLSIIAERLDRERVRYGLFFETGAGYDSNVNNATADDQVAVPALGGVLVNLDPASRDRASKLWTVAGGGSFTAPLADRWALYGSASLDHRLAVGESDFTRFTATGDLGVEWQADGDDTLRVAATAQRFDVGGDRNRELAGATLQWQRALDARNQVTAFGQVAALRFPGQPLRDVNRYTGGVGWGHAFGGRGSPVLYASVYGGVEDADARAADQVARGLAGLRLGGQYTIDARWQAYGSLDWQYSDYDGDEPAFRKARNEHYVGIAGGLRYRLRDGWSVRPQLAWARNDGNIALFEYDRWEATVTLRNDF